MRKSIKGFVTVALVLASAATVALVSEFNALPASGVGAVVTFTASPSNSTGGIAFAVQPVVTVSGPSATADAQVTLTVNTGPGTLTCASGTTVTAVDFVASFSGCSITTAFNGYVLRAADASDGGFNTSASFNVTDGAAYKLGFTTQPISGSAGNLFVGGNIGSPVVTIEDAGGNPAVSNSTDNSTVVTLVISPNPGEGTLNCTESNPVVVSSGVAIFGLCAINKEDPGSGYTLLASATGLLASELLPEFSATFDVTYTTAVASQLVFTDQPAPGASEPMNGTFPIDVSLEDTFGNLERNNGATDVELSFTGSGTFGCTGAVGLEESTSEGSADFSGCSANTVQNDVQITAATNNDGHVPNGITTAGSDLFNIVEPPTHLVFATEPGNGGAGSPISPQPVVDLEGVGGATAASSDLISLTIGTNPGSGTLSCAPVSAVDGVATFANCSIGSIGNGYTLMATDSTNPGTITGATSSPFDVTAPDHLAFTIQPGGTTTQVTVENPSDDPVTSGPGSTDLIALGLGSDPSGGTFTCAPATAVAGVATFVGCAVSIPGNGYTLIATDSSGGGVTGATSLPFNVAAGVGPATHLAFTAQPGNGAPGHPLSEQPSVSIENAANVPVASTDAITLTISTNPSSGVLTCTANPISAVVGVATYLGCAINDAGSGYVLTATDPADPTLTPAISSAFNVSATTPLPVQIYGFTAIGTSIAVSQAEFPVPGSAHSVVLARSDFFSDALAGGPLAAATDGPLLVTPGAALSSTLDPGVQTEIERVLPVGDTVYILGGTLALSSNIDTTLTGLGYVVVRVAGYTEYGTAIEIAEALGNPTTIFEATGLTFYDALSADPAAIEEHGAILLTDGATQDPETATYLAAHPSDTRFAVGGSLAALGADPTATGIFGADAYATSAAVATYFFPDANSFAAATGLSYTDALAGGVFMATGGRMGPILLVNPSVVPSVSEAVAAYLATLTMGTQGYVIGGPLAVPAQVLTALQADVG